MALLKFKVSGSFLDRSYYSKIYEIETNDFEDKDDIEDHLKYLTQIDQSEICYDWKDEGSEDVGGGFEISSIQQI